MEDNINYKDSKQKWTIIKNFENIDLDQVKLEIYHPITEEILVDVTWNAKDFFKKIVDLQYEYAK
jgi:hypothetical protein